jgi:transcriptional regulator with XRE-family HTH domain
MFAVMDGERVEAMRRELGLSRREFATAAGIGETTAARVESGERVLVSTAWRVAELFGMHPKEIGRPAPTSPVWRRLMELDGA